MEPDLRPTPAEQERVRWAVRFEITKRVLILFTAVLVTVAVGMLISLARDNHQTLDAINSCTHPGRACYQRSQKATAAAVGNINAYIAASAGCAVKLAPHADQMSQTQLVDRITACVVRQLADRTP